MNVEIFVNGVKMAECTSISFKRDPIRDPDPDAYTYENLKPGPLYVQGDLIADSIDILFLCMMIYPDDEKARIYDCITLYGIPEVPDE